MANIQAAIEQAKANRDTYLEQLKELLAIPSISTLPENKGDVERAAQWLADQLKGLGMTRVDVRPTGGHPLVYAEWLGAPGAPTLLVYGHYDVQPVDPLDEWESDPFGAAIRDDYIYARGASDMKSQIFAQFKAVECLVENGGLPINIKYLLEGEEEVGSPHLGAFIEENKKLLACDFVLNCDSGIAAPDTPAIIYALRGLAYFELEVRTHDADLHSGLFGGSVRNPAHVLCELIAGMHDENGRVTLPGFYDAVRELDEEEREALAKLPYSDEGWLELAGTRGLFGETGYTTIERVGARPTLEVNGIWSGFTGEGEKTVLPAVATAKISMRLVADQIPEDINQQLCAYLGDCVPESVDWTVREMVHGPGSIMDRRSPVIQAAVKAFKEVFGKGPVFRREGGSVPVVGMMQQKLGAESVMLGFALPGDGIHGPNERQYLPNVFKGIETYIHFMATLG